MLAMFNARFAYKGFRGMATDIRTRRGYKVSGKVRQSPELTRIANEIIARWCTVISVLALIPAVALVLGILPDVGIGARPWNVVIVVFYMWGLCSAMIYPQLRLSRL
ncbi:hypothetical protein BFN03_17865 [Rhodococcus sp. WMMA185]|nr:hypothetical protein BFN03_17865 [Rhodococcus sp. WMMA185]